MSVNALSLKNQQKKSEHGVKAAAAPNSRIKQVWLGIYFPDISLVAHQAPESVPFAIVEQCHGKTQIYHSNALARAQGVEPAMPLTAAYALCQSLCVVTRNRQAELNYLQKYAGTVMCFTPRISLSEPDIVLLEVHSSLRMLGGMKHLYRQLKTALNMPHIIACAPVAEAAELMARHGIEKAVHSCDHLKSALGEIMLAMTPIEKKLVQQLACCGLYSLRDMWRLPRPDLTRRFGPDLLCYLDSLSGQGFNVPALFEAKPRFVTNYDFDRETGDSRYVLYAAELLLQQAQRFLQARVLLSEKISLRLVYAHRHGTDRRWMTLDIHAQHGGDTPANFMPQLAEKLHRTVFESELSGIELQIDQFKPRTGTNRDLFKKSLPVADSWPVLLDLLFARIGQKRVYRLHIMADHLPEKAWEKKPAQPGLSKKQAMHRVPERPAWLFRRPLRCSVQGFKLTGDAERLESGWWSTSDQRREYYKGIAVSGQRCWLYRSLQPADGWYLHGLFA